MEYIQGEKVTLFDSTYYVEKVYQLTADYMKLHDLYYRNRVTLRKISGENGLDTMDFAITTD